MTMETSSSVHSSVPPAAAGEQSRKSRRGHWKFGLAPVLATALFSVWWAVKSPAKPTQALNASLPAVAVTKVVRGDLAQGHVFDAELRPYEEIELHAKVSGFVDKIVVDIGDKVQAGQLIAVLEIPELEDDLRHAEAVEKRSAEEVLKADAAHEETHLTAGRLQSVEKSRPNLVAQQDIDQALSRDRAAEAALAAAKQQVEVARADIKKLHTMMAYSRITAPFSGVITERFTDPGALIVGGTSSSTPLVRLSQNERLRLVFPVSVTYVAQIKLGDPVEIRVQSLNKTFPGKISRFTRKIESATRTMDVEVDMENPSLELVPGMYGSVLMNLERRQQTLVVPVEAVSRQQNSTVFVVNPAGEIEERKVTVGLETPEKLEVLAGLKENELVMIGSRTQIRPGQKVQPKLVQTENN